MLLCCSTILTTLSSTKRTSIVLASGRGSVLAFFSCPETTPTIVHCTIRLTALLGLVILGSPVRAADPLPSWNEGATKKSILDFVAKVTKEGGRDFVPIPERIATFDNDGTLWCEKPMYVQVVYAV